MLARLLVAALVAHAGAPLTYYGTTEYGGDHGDGSIFRADGKQYTRLYSFCSIGTGYCYDGARPVSNMVPLPDGSWIGTTSKGGDGAGTIFRLYPSGQLTIVWSVCWTIDVCDAFGTPRGTLAFMETDKHGAFVLEGTCERKGRGVHYRLTLTASEGNAIIPVKYWTHRHAYAQPPATPHLGPEKRIAFLPAR